MREILLVSATVLLASLGAYVAARQAAPRPVEIISPTPEKTGNVGIVVNGQEVLAFDGRRLSINGQTQNPDPAHAPDIPSVRIVIDGKDIIRVDNGTLLIDGLALAGSRPAPWPP